MIPEGKSAEISITKVNQFWKNLSSFVFVTKTSFIDNAKGTLGSFKRDFDILDESLGMHI